MPHPRRPSSPRASENTPTPHPATTEAAPRPGAVPPGAGLSAAEETPPAPRAEAKPPEPDPHPATELPTAADPREPANLHVASEPRDPANLPTATEPPVPGTPTAAEPTAPAHPLTPDPPSPAHTPPPTLHDHLRTHLPPTPFAWLNQALTQLPSWERHFTEAARRCGPRYADAARVLLLHAAHPDTPALTRLYAHATPPERRAILHALPHLTVTPDALPLVEDALRTNDTTLVAAALGPYAARHLDAHAWRHAVLKCLFTGVPVDEVAGLEDRARGDTELARMLRDQAAERTAAGRPVQPDLRRVLALAETPRPGPEQPRHPAGPAPKTETPAPKREPTPPKPSTQAPNLPPQPATQAPNLPPQPAAEAPNLPPQPAAEAPNLPPNPPPQPPAQAPTPPAQAPRRTEP
ncbi:EboA domain-containing protein [Streptomyces niveiscabiei]|uniref:EboA domain-containing protein n=1 Tax=Streptomyces niveiscabiei TaxID=164115 RepID=UPI00389B3252